MGFVLLLAILFVIAVFVAGTVATFRQALRVFRDTGSFLRGIATATETFARKLARLGDSTARAGERPAELAGALERLAASRARLRVLTSALARVRAEATGVTSLYPQKAPLAAPTIRPRWLGLRGRLK